MRDMLEKLHNEDSFFRKKALQALVNSNRNRRGSVWLTNNQKSILVKKDNISQYIDDGWRLGRK